MDNFNVELASAEQAQSVAESMKAQPGFIPAGVQVEIIDYGIPSSSVFGPIYIPASGNAAGSTHRTVKWGNYETVAGGAWVAMQEYPNGSWQVRADAVVWVGDSAVRGDGLVGEPYGTGFLPGPKFNQAAAYSGQVVIDGGVAYIVQVDVSAPYPTPTTVLYRK